MQGNLVITRYEGERVRIRTGSGEIIWVTLASVQKNKGRLAIQADKSVEVLREELVPEAERYPAGV